LIRSNQKQHNMKNKNIRSIAGWIACTAVLATSVPAARASVLWEATASKGTAVFEGLEESPGTIAVVNDPLGTYGSVYRYNTSDNNGVKSRCESRGCRSNGSNVRMAYDGTYYIGWRAMWNPMPTSGSWVAVFQLHAYNCPNGCGAPLVLKTVNGDGNLYLHNDENANQAIWHTSFKKNVWQKFVLHVHLNTSASSGWVELWYNGTQQKFSNGQTRFNCSLWDVSGSYDLLKWGVYRSGTVSGNASAYMSRARVGTSYSDVAP
jgi:hypothetical protein